MRSLSRQFKIPCTVLIPFYTPFVKSAWYHTCVLNLVSKSTEKQESVSSILGRSEFKISSTLSTAGFRISLALAVYSFVAEFGRWMAFLGFIILFALSLSSVLVGQLDIFSLLALRLDLSSHFAGWLDLSSFLAGWLDLSSLRTTKSLCRISRIVQTSRTYK